MHLLDKPREFYDSSIWINRYRLFIVGLMARQVKAAVIMWLLLCVLLYVEMITVACSEHFCSVWSGLNPFNGTAASRFYITNPFQVLFAWEATQRMYSFISECVCAKASEFLTELIISSKGESVNMLDSTQSPSTATAVWSHTCLMLSDLSHGSYTCLTVSRLSNGLSLRPVLWSQINFSLHYMKRRCPKKPF